MLNRRLKKKLIIIILVTNPRGLLQRFLRSNKNNNNMNSTYTNGNYIDTLMSRTYTSDIIHNII